ncbi:hypothetical protein MLD38_004452 [Melastoma candidum]|uniref:Uncharacterized protein n=1 Tax=Melastoma candidum TaxID=119954 RepID=A0ACB9S9L8_9MYRT|nr:hypothetical protein MLD38_004452 [Melastoma candidum]
MAGTVEEDMHAVETPRLDHTPFYCEENVYLLCKKLSSTGVANADSSDLFVIFVSNDRKQIPLWHQKASKSEDGFIVWDYHVICVQRKSGTSCIVWDLDSDLPFPSPLNFYLSETVRPLSPHLTEYQRLFRVIHAPMFIRSFGSDRRHMKDSEGNWQAPPPLHDTIVAEDGTVHNLNEYMEIRAVDLIVILDDSVVNGVYSQKFGIIMGENQLLEFFSLLP